MNLIDVLRIGPVMPVIVIRNLEHAAPLARALHRGGIRVFEVTLRTDVALDAVKAMRDAVPDAIVGVGTVTRPQDLESAVSAGAMFAVSPGLTKELAEAAVAPALPLLPGVMTPAELMEARTLGFEALKFFPAREAGGVGMLRALAGPFPDVVFCPTGGVTFETAPSYLELPNVACVGGSWLAPIEMMERGDWDGISRLAESAAALRVQS
ncbi:bifunctional 4-hydroxy-2-oxoglutarate aldolase/2-dehydro-3-deoxy-phosphogluconate aldolase [Niveibacterium umoris]|uniref:2-dehydro-3-deoxy-phosphogluconate aldolase n=1 Tax=Niveibacterium umoris TaxID=1193620 RepID=A0A840BEP6_9RHOO|nr:bifunctional 4-hydroxy-2-oxoglutarate aldolase/2-dehydro-3-deoxy-phosphogluconate aldolase [Niveibacterium umoris]MBB4011163.1 2-dehydro-3-deoxyphosphogluconate aldolase/(4S)-4-hydroxy-2-oxoglutarate aldolase [Niveibacterium umoris]